MEYYDSDSDSDSVCIHLQMCKSSDKPIHMHLKLSTGK